MVQTSLCVLQAPRPLCSRRRKRGPDIFATETTIPILCGKGKRFARKIHPAHGETARRAYRFAFSCSSASRVRWLSRYSEIASSSRRFASSSDAVSQLRPRHGQVAAAAQSFSIMTCTFTSPILRADTDTCVPCIHRHKAGLHTVDGKQVVGGLRALPRSCSAGTTVGKHDGTAHIDFRVRDKLRFVGITFKRRIEQLSSLPASARPCAASKRLPRTCARPCAAQKLRVSSMMPASRACASSGCKAVLLGPCR